MFLCVDVDISLRFYLNLMRIPPWVSLAEKDSFLYLAAVVEIESYACGTDNYCRTKHQPFSTAIGNSDSTTNDRIGRCD